MRDTTLALTLAHAALSPLSPNLYTLLFALLFDLLLIRHPVNLKIIAECANNILLYLN